MAKKDACMNWCAVLCMHACTCMPSDGNNQLGRPIASCPEFFANLVAWWLKEQCGWICPPPPGKPGLDWSLVKIGLKGFWKHYFIPKITLPQN